MAETGETSLLCVRKITAEQTGELRHLVLWPHKPRDFVRLDEDEDGDHFGAFFPSQDEPVAVISVFFERIPAPGTNKDGNEGSQHRISARFRKFACHPDFQGRGIGTKLLNYIASYCWGMGAKILWCDARLSSSQWYQKRGLVSFGDSFFKESVEYTRMKMDLVNTDAS
ncbi:hypothetical protein BDN67DRAFT_968337 [Paxillus ammoniavirescens]|nr:hypothetical protein BDN67DRAFT_968337 [Paxillus ammoniavirescens]